MGVKASICVQTSPVLAKHWPTCMEALTLNCPMCGAPSTSDATKCDHCGARLATVACPSCFGMIFIGSKFCQHCGTKVERSEENDPNAAAHACPRCNETLAAIELGSSKVLECPHCSGLWIDTDTFNEICADREKQAAVIPENTQKLPPVTAADFSLDSVRYVPCPTCKQLMNRMNFAHESGVILDICKAHGVWFDREELRRIVEFIRGGGLEASRERDREDWKAEERKLNALSRTQTPGEGLYLAPGAPPQPFYAGSLLVDLAAFVAKLLLK